MICGKDTVLQLDLNQVLSLLLHVYQPGYEQQNQLLSPFGDGQRWF